MLSDDFSPGLQVCSKASCMLSFILCSTRGIEDPIALKTIALLCIGDVTSEVFNVQMSWDTSDIQWIQERFHRVFGVHQGIPYWEMSVAARADRLNFLPLRPRRSIQDGMFLFKLLRGTINCSDLLGSMQLRFPSGFISPELLVCNKTQCLTSNSKVWQNVGFCAVDFFTKMLHSLRS